MELYEFSENGKSLLVKELKATKEALENYRRAHMLSFDYAFYTLETENRDMIKKFQTEDKLKYEEEDLNETFFYHDSKEASLFERKQGEQALEEYLRGAYQEKHLIQLYNEGWNEEPRSIGKYLITDPEEIFLFRIEKKKYYRLQNILCLPNELAALELFEQGKYDLLAYRPLEAEIPYELYEETLKAKYPASIMELDMMQDRKSLVKSTQRLLSYYRNKRK